MKNLGLYGLLIVFGAFILLLVINPNLSCFGRKLKSPFYPLMRRKKLARDRARLSQVRTADYGFKLVEDAPTRPAGAPPASPPHPPATADKSKKKTDDYGFKLD